nr:hypothetical protein OH820_28030 [Streptomyces sp. NBC_00857]
MNSVGAVSRLVVFGDACGSGALGMEAKKRMRDALYGSFGEAYGSVGVELGRIHQEDRGDGILTALDPGTPPTLMVGRWLETLYQCLREHNWSSADRLRLRVGMNLGPVFDDGRGLVGRAVDLACRLCDSPTAKQIMVDAPGADLLLVVSDWLYANVVAEGGRYVEPEHYRSAHVRFKETDETAWFHIPRLSAPPVPRLSEPSASGGTARHKTGGGPTLGDGPPPPEPGPGDGPRLPESGSGDGPQSSGAGRTINAQGDLQYFEGNVIHGGFTGFSKGSGRSDRSDRPDRSDRTTGTEAGDGA